MSLDYNKFLKKGVTVGLASALLASQMMMMSSQVKAESSSDTNYTKVNLTTKKLKKTKIKTNKAIQDGEKVRVIVELEGEPAITYAQDKGVRYKDLASSTRNKLEKDLQNEQQAFLNDVKEEKVNLKVENSFTTVLNGVSGEMESDDIEKLEKLPGVESVSIATKYDRPKEKPNMTTSKEMVEAQQTWKTGYNGKGTVVGIIDTGIDYKHKDMKLTTNDGEKLSKSKTDELISKNSLPGKFYSDKVPYGYNYADKNEELLDLGPDASMHGMHVAGTVAANGNEESGGIQGVAPEAQLLALKVFGNDPAMPSTFGDIYIKAIDDAIKLGADVLNMSLGSTAGFVDDNNLEQKAVDNAVNNGIVMSISAGNSDNISSQFGEKPLATNPDIGLVGSPSVSKSSLSVASIENNKISLNQFSIKIGDETLAIPYKTQSSPNPLDVFGTKEMDVVYVGDGSAAQYKDKDVKGKVVVAARVASEPNYGQIQAEAEKAGAAGVIVKGLEAHGDYVSMALNSPTIPMVSLAQSEGNALIEKLKEGSGTGKVTFTGKQQNVVNTAAGKMSTFTSWGVTPSLELKPEITAPGGQIYSTLNNNKYGLMSGTSMAAPHVSGGAALVLQRVKELYPDIKNEERSKLAKVMLMNTAKPVEDPENGGVYYSPRRQGTGIMQLQSAVTTPVYVVNKESNEGKVELKEIKGDSFTFTLKATNVSNENIKYEVNTSVLTDAVTGGKIDLKEQNIAQANVTVDQPEFTVPAKASKEVTVTVDLKNAKEKLESLMKNGYFVEGFVSLENKSDQAAPTLTVPFVGFKGDWNKAPILDKMAYDENSYLGASVMVDEKEEALGENAVTGDLDEDKIAFSPNGDNASDSIAPALTFLRNSKSVEYSIVDAEGNTLRKLATTGNQTKNYDIKEPVAFNPEKTTWDGFIKNKKAKDGKYFYQVKTQLDYAGKEPQTVKIPVIVDTVKPVVSNATVDVKNEKVNFQATDRNGSGLQYVEVFVDGKSRGKFDPAGKTAFDIDLPFIKNTSKVEVSAVDYANNKVRTTISPAVDETIPYIVTTSPEALGVFDVRTIPVTGYVEDRSSVKSLKVSSSQLVGGQVEVPISYDESTSRYEFNKQLTFKKDGIHELFFTGEDKAGNKISFKRQIIVDTTPAKLAISGIPKDYYVGENAKNPTLKVKASDNFDDLRLVVDGDEEYKHDFDEPFEMRAISHTVNVPLSLKDGKNTVAIEATDLSGHVTKEKIVIYKGQKPAKAPAQNSGSLVSVAPPTIKTITVGSKTIEGTAPKNTTVTITDNDKLTFKAKTSSNGTFKYKLPSKLKVDTVLSAKAVDRSSKRESAEIKTVVVEADATIPLIVKEISDKDKVVAGETKANATIQVYKLGKVIATKKANKKGKFSVTIPKQKAGNVLTIKVVDGASANSSSVKMKVVDKTPPARPTATKSVTAQTTRITGKAEAGSTVYVKVKSNVIGKAVADKKGKYSIKIKKQKAKTVLTIYAKDKAGNTSKKLKVKVGK